MLHTLVCKTGDKWAAFIREHETVPWNRLHVGNVLRPAVEASFAYGFATPWTFSERQLDEVAVDLAEEPELLAGVSRAIDLEILAPERRFPTDDRWASVYKSPGRADLWSPGLSSSFRGFRGEAMNEVVIKDKILDFFGFNRPDNDHYWRTFLPPQSGVSRLRELYIRADWNARGLAPSSFPQFRAGPVVTDEQAARRNSRMPQNKSAVRRAQHQANAERFKVESSERARLRGEVA